MKFGVWRSVDVQLIIGNTEMESLVKVWVCIMNWCTTEVAVGFDVLSALRSTKAANGLFGNNYDE